MNKRNIKSSSQKDSKEDLIKKAFNAHSKGTIKEAANYYQLFLDEGFVDPRVLSNYGVILKKLGKLDQAIELFKESISLFPNAYEAYLNLSNILIDQCAFKEAEIYINKALEIKPDDISINWSFSTLLMKSNRLKEAVPYIEKVINLKDDSDEAFARIAGIYLDLNNIKNSLKYTKKCLKLNPNSASAHYIYSCILIKENKFTEAELYIRKAISINSNIPEYYCNLGMILKTIGNLDEAEKSSRLAIKLRPNFPEALFNLGNTLKSKGAMNDAMKYTKKACEINPNFAEAYSNLGSIFDSLDKKEEAKSYFIKAIQIKPGYVDAHMNLAHNFYSKGQWELALEKLIDIKETFPGSQKAEITISEILKYIDPSIIEKKLIRKILTSLIEKNYIDHKNLFHCFSLLYEDQIKKIINSDNTINENLHYFNLINDKYFIESIKKIQIRDQKWEHFITSIRKNILIHIFTEKEHDQYLEKNKRLLNALAQQCFQNEYAFFTDNEEDKFICKLVEKLKNKSIENNLLFLIACYLPLYKIEESRSSLISNYQEDILLDELLSLQLREPLKEEELAKGIKEIGIIKDTISKEVKAQYEENPYPRWRYTNLNILNTNQDLIPNINNDINPNYICCEEDLSQPKVLIAGCGTGHQIIQALRYKKSQITAIDLSKTSLAYAQRKINELKVNNVEIIMMDLLDINLLQTEFNVIECGGVLHHMNDPEKGLRALVKVLKKKGFMKLALYSELARKDIIKAREYIKDQKISPTKNNIKKFRQDVLNNKLEELSTLKSINDFYSISMCRDLCFNVQEHRFTIGQIQTILDKENLRFLGFVLPVSIKNAYKEQFPKDEKMIDLNNWSLFEKKNKNTFRAMYQFWVQKN